LRAQHAGALGVGRRSSRTELPPLRHFKKGLQLKPSQIICASLLGISVLLNVVFPKDPAMVAMTFILATLFGFVLFLEIKDTHSNDDIKEQIKHLKDQIQALMIRNGLGR
jgi:hypothetical protein